jgi:ferrous iron transport protein B
MRKVGLNGRSIIPLVGGFACAIPSIMATRTIRNKKERLATMLLVPLMSCSARLPVYVLLISLIIPKGTFWGPIPAQTALMTGAYFVGIALAIVLAWIFKRVQRTQDSSEFVLELPTYQPPRLQTVIQGAWIKCKAFLSEAGKVIILISMILWALSSFGPGEAMQNAERRAESESASILSTEDRENQISELKNTYRLEASYAGKMGKFIEPAIRPLGYDWKTGIALISSFAAREVFVGTMSTLFTNSGGSKNVVGIRKKMQAQKDPETGKPLYGAAYAISLMLFYAFALQCMSTVAIVKKETGKTKWAVIQFIYMTVLAYGSSLVVYQIFG